MEKVTSDAFNALTVTSFLQSGVTPRLDVGPGQSALAARTHRWEEFKKDCGKEDVAQTFPHDRTVGLEIPDLTLYRHPLAESVEKKKAQCQLNSRADLRSDCLRRSRVR